MSTPQEAELSTVASALKTVIHCLSSEEPFQKAWNDLKERYEGPLDLDSAVSKCQSCSGLKVNDDLEDDKKGQVYLEIKSCFDELSQNMINPPVEANRRNAEYCSRFCEAMSLYETDQEEFRHKV